MGIPLDGTGQKNMSHGQACQSEADCVNPPRDKVKRYSKHSNAE